MEVQLDISKNLRDQFSEFFKVEEKNGVLTMGSTIGTGQMEYVELPNQLEFYHFRKSQFKVPIDMKSINPIGTQWFLIHINLSNVKQEKRVEGRLINFQKYLPTGILLYGPDLEIETKIPPNVDSELATIRFHQSFLETYFGEESERIEIDKNLIYEDLDYQLEKKLSLALSTMDDKMLCHAHVLDFMGHFFKKLKARERGTAKEKLHADDIKNLFAAVAHLRNPIAEKPTLDELASVAKMSTTKFKTSFRQLFGSAPIQYHHKIRMEFARDEIQANRKSPIEMSNDLGYSHPSNFTIAYKKHFNELPSAH